MQVSLQWWLDKRDLLSSALLLQQHSRSSHQTPCFGVTPLFVVNQMLNYITSVAVRQWNQCMVCELIKESTDRKGQLAQYSFCCLSADISLHASSSHWISRPAFDHAISLVQSSFDLMLAFVLMSLNRSLLHWTFLLLEYCGYRNGREVLRKQTWILSIDRSTNSGQTCSSTVKVSKGKQTQSFYTSSLNVNAKSNPIAASNYFDVVFVDSSLTLRVRIVCHSKARGRRSNNYHFDHFHHRQEWLSLTFMAQTPWRFTFSSSPFTNVCSEGFLLVPHSARLFSKQKRNEKNRKRSSRMTGTCLTFASRNSYYSKLASYLLVYSCYWHPRSFTILWSRCSTKKRESGLSKSYYHSSDARLYSFDSLHPLFARLFSDAIPSGLPLSCSFFELLFMFCEIEKSESLIKATRPKTNIRDETCTHFSEQTLVNDGPSVW